MIKLKIKTLHREAKVPNYAHPSDAGLDLCTIEKIELKAGERKVIKTGLALEMPDGFVGLVWDKSGLATKNGLTSLAGVIDAGYRGEVMVCLLNASKEDYVFEIGDKVAQLLIQPLVQAEIEVVESLNESNRGEGGFGSTGR